MRVFRSLLLLLLVLLASGEMTRAQDGLDLPTELYVLTNGGQVQRYGIGMAGLARVSPQEAFVLDFGIAPDGNWMAYRTESGLTLLNLFTGQSALIDGASASVPAARGRGDTMAWTASGDALAYTTMTGGRVFFNSPTGTAFADLGEDPFISLLWSPTGEYLAAEADQNVWWVYQRSGTALTLTSAIPSSVGITWVSGAQVVFAPLDGGLFRMDMANGNTQVLLLDTTWEYRMPYLMPGGVLAVFGRQKGDTSIPAGSGRLIGLAPGAPQIQNLGDAAVDLTGLHWAPGGGLMVALRGGALALVLPVSGDGLTLPVGDAVAYSWGPNPLPDAVNVILPADAYFITPDSSDIPQVWQLSRQGSTARPITHAAAEVLRYALAADGSQIVYASGGQLWRQSTTQNTPPQPLADLPDGIGGLALSADGTQVAFTTGNSGAVWLVPEGGAAQKLDIPAPPSAVFGNPSFNRDGSALLLSLNANQYPSQLIAVDLMAVPPVRLEVGVADSGVWLNDGGLLAWSDGGGLNETPGVTTLYRADPSAPAVLRTLAIIPAPVRILGLREVAAGRARLLLGFLQAGPRAVNVVEMDTLSGAFTPAASGGGGFMVFPQLSPDGDFLIGQVHDAGPITVRDLRVGGQVIYRDLPQVTNVHWGS